MERRAILVSNVLRNFKLLIAWKFYIVLKSKKKYQNQLFKLFPKNLQPLQAKPYFLEFKETSKIGGISFPTE